jgi:hypothetical protein
MIVYGSEIKKLKLKIKVIPQLDGGGDAHIDTVNPIRYIDPSLPRLTFVC